VMWGTRADSFYGGHDFQQTSHDWSANQSAERHRDGWPSGDQQRLMQQQLAQHQHAASLQQQAIQQHVLQKLQQEMIANQQGHQPPAWDSSRKDEKRSPVLQLSLALGVQPETLGMQGYDPQAIREYHKQEQQFEARSLQRLRTAQGAKDMPVKGQRTGQQLRQLLDFYFEPFNLQHNKYLIDLIYRKVGTPKKAGPLPVEAIFDFSFGLQELLGLNRIAAALEKLRNSGCEAGPWPTGMAGSSMLYVRRRGSKTIPPDYNNEVVGYEVGDLKHLMWTESGQLTLKSFFEVRIFVAVNGALPADVFPAAVSGQVSTLWEQQSQAPGRILSIIGLNLGTELEKSFDEHQAQQYQGQLKRQLMLFRSDLICLQGLNPLTGCVGEVIAAALKDEGFDYAWAAGADSGEASCIFWDARRLSLVRHFEHDGAVAVDLQAHLCEESPGIIRVVNIKAKVPTSDDNGLEHLFDRQDGQPLIVCADCSNLGGAEAFSVMEEFQRLRSLAFEVFGKEMQVPLGSFERTGASNVNKLVSPDCLLFEGLSPSVALSGYSEPYMSTLAPQDIISQFPGFRMPMLGSFDWRTVATPEVVIAPSEEQPNIKEPNEEPSENAVDEDAAQSEEQPGVKKPEEMSKEELLEYIKGFEASQAPP